MNQYNIYTNPQREMEAVKQGWSWPAFFYGCIWAFIKGMWGLGIGAFITYAMVCLLAELAGTDTLPRASFMLRP